MLLKSFEFKNCVNQQVKVIEIPVPEGHHYDWVVQAHLQNYVSALYDQPQEKAIFSFRDYLKRRMKWSEFQKLFDHQTFKNNA